MKTFASMLFSLVVTVAAWAQDDPKKEEPQPAPQDEMSPDQALQELEEISKIMRQAEETLHAASLGKAATEQEEVLKRLEDLEKNPDALQKQVLKLIDKLLKKSEEDQGDVIERITQVIKKAKKSQSQSKRRQKPEDQQKQQQKKKGQRKPMPNAGSPAQKPYNPNRTDPASKFRSTNDRYGEWGNLPSKERDAMLHERRAADNFPLEFREMLKEYWEAVLRGGD